MSGERDAAPGGGLALEVHGARGSMAVSGPSFARHGGNTTCYAIELPEAHYVVFDAGTGLGRLQARRTAAGDTRPFTATIFLTHFHWDHIQGLPVFTPLFDASTTLHFVAAPPPNMTIEEALDGAMRPPWWPVRFRDAPAKMTYEEVSDAPVRVGPLEVHASALRHPGGVTGYRVDHDGRATVIATDVEGGDPEHDAALERLATGALTLLHDAQYTPEEYEEKRGGWGHSTWEHAAEAARRAGVQRLVLTSHEPNRTDEGVDMIVAEARRLFPATEAAYEGQRIPL